MLISRVMTVTNTKPKMVVDDVVSRGNCRNTVNTKLIRTGPMTAITDSSKICSDNYRHDTITVPVAK